MRLHFKSALATSALLLGALMACIWAPGATAKSPGVMLKPRTQEQLEASQLLIQGSQLLKAHQPFKARPLMERAAALWPDEAHVHFTLGACYSEAGDFARAVGEFERAYQLDKSLSECLPNLGTCYQLMNDYTKAISYFQEYLHRNPGAADAGQIKGMIAALNRQAERQVDSDPQSGDYLPSVCRNGRIERWQRNRLPLKVYISNGTDDQGRLVPGFREEFNETLLSSLDTWVRASDFRLAYTLVDDAGAADIVCTWTDRKDFLKEQSTSVEAGAARLKTVGTSPNQGEILHVQVTILLVNPSNGRPISDEEVKKTCLHELGHALGLSGHSMNNKDVMFYSESPSMWAALTKRDKNTIARLYGDYPIFTWSTAGWPQQPSNWH